jgi:predicted nucleotidyltransferase
MKFEEEMLISMFVAGSHMYGTNTKDSDVDYRGVFIPTFLMMIDPFEQLETYIETKETDTQYWSLAKFFRLAEVANPNILELMWAQNLMPTPTWDLIIEKRELFLSKKMIGTFFGYANQQLDRIERHKKWIENPPSKPDRKDYGLPIDDSVLNETQLQAVMHIPKKFFYPEEYKAIEGEVEYRVAVEIYDKYLLWLKYRNPERARIEKRVGYDTKHAMHLLRLYFECQSLISKHMIEFPLPEKEFLMQIKEGVFNYNEIMKFKEEQEIILKKLIELYPLPDAPNRDLLRKLYFDILFCSDLDRIEKTR